MTEMFTSLLGTAFILQVRKDIRKRRGGRRQQILDELKEN
jgi:hypothetical protein